MLVWNLQGGFHFWKDFFQRVLLIVVYKCLQLQNCMQLQLLKNQARD